jgi:hypothetical protein
MAKVQKQEEQFDPRLTRVGEKLKELRIKKGYSSYEQFAFDNELPRSGYGDHEKGKNMTLASLIRLLDIHGLSLKEFFKDLK